MSNGVRLALRRLSHRPAEAIGAVCTLALGIGATIAVMTVVDSAVVNRPSWPGSDRLVNIYDVDRDRRTTAPDTWNRQTLSFRVWKQLRTAHEFEAVEVWHRVPPPILRFGDRPIAQCQAVMTSAGMLRLAGLTAQLGRLFGQADDLGDSQAILISESAWYRWFGGRQDAVGETVSLAYAYTTKPMVKRIVGVLRQGFRIGGIEPDVILPLQAMMASVDSSAGFGVARLRAGVAPSVAGDASTAMLRAAEGGAHEARVVSMIDDAVGDRGRPLWILLGAAGILLLIACSNVSCLLISSVVNRSHDIAIQLAMGASRSAVVAPFLWEYLILALTSAVLGFAVATGLVHVLAAMIPKGIIGVAIVSPDVRLAGGAIVIGICTTFLAGCLPVVAAATLAPGSLLRMVRVSRLTQRQGPQRAFVTIQVALALVLLIGGSLFAETALRVRSLPVPFSTDGLYVIDAQYLGPEDGRATELPSQPVLSALRGLPGVQSAATVSTAPFFGEGIRTGITTDQGRSYLAEQRVVSEGYFTTMQMPLTAGNGLSDAVGGRTPAVVSESFARSYLGGAAMGRHFSRGDAETFEVVGVVPDVKKHSQVDEPAGTFYALAGITGGRLAFVVRKRPGLALSAPEVRRVFQQAGGSFEPTAISSVTGQLLASMAEETFRAFMATAFAVVALALAAIGIYALTLQDSIRRRRDFAIRLALGGSPRDVLIDLFRRAASPVLIGLCCGLPIAFIESKLVQSLLYGVQATSLRVYAVAAVALLAAAFVSMLVPARRALSVDLRSTLADN